MGARQGLLPGIALLLAGCVVGPDYEAPDYSVPDEWRAAVVEELESGALVAVPLRGFDVKRDFYLVSRQESALSPAARAFRSAVLESV